MQFITFKCEIITPMFMGGADGVTPELRAPSIKGAMRFWWRAMNGDLPLEQLRKQETELFGGVGKDDEGRRSAFNIWLGKTNVVPDSNLELVPHKEKRTKGNGFRSGGKFEVVFSMLNDTEGASLKQIAAIFQLTCLLGGFGKRVRRGMGCMCVVSCYSHDSENKDKNVDDLINLIKAALPRKKELLFNKIDEYTLKTNFKIKNPYPYVERIDIGRPRNPTQAALGISQTTHDLKFDKSRGVNHRYEPSLGYVLGKHRFASPIFASIGSINEKFVTIATTLNTVPGKDHNGRPFTKNDIDFSLQETFRKNIL